VTAETEPSELPDPTDGISEGPVQEEEPDLEVVDTRRSRAELPAEAEEPVTAAEPRRSRSRDVEPDWSAPSREARDRGTSRRTPTPTASDRSSSWTERGGGRRSDSGRDNEVFPTRESPAEEFVEAREDDLDLADEEVALLTRESLTELGERARRGRLGAEQIAQLEAVQPGTANFNRSRAVLLAQFDATRSRSKHCAVAEEVLGQPQNRANPQFNLEMGKCHLRSGRYSKALSSARSAEERAQDIPKKIRNDRLLRILELQAKAHKGRYQKSDNLDYIEDAIVAWKRYRTIAENTYRTREADKADKEIRALVELRAGAL
ncbi:MAG: hypothetical protein VX498_05925, partial [Myxococcota bacterium]|nr:hypothetical protein [Myxococcota bacterium]